MANIRTLKKEIDTCVYEVISDCLTYSALNPEKNQDDVSSLISEAVMLRNNLFRNSMVSMCRCGFCRLKADRRMMSQQ